MDPVKNPFSPGAGSPPPELVGRDPIIAQSRILFGRVKNRRSEKSMLLTGLRGVGKTVLLNEMARLAKEAEYRTLIFEAHENKPLGPMIAQHLRSVFFDLDMMAGAGDKVKRGLRVLRSFFSGLKISYKDITIGLDIEPEPGAADSGDLEIDLTNLLVAVAEAAEERNSAVAILIDEIQYLNQKELGALIMALHRIQQLQLPLVLLGAGLPILPALAGESKSYAERLFDFPAVGALSENDSAKALREPTLAMGATFEEAALQQIYRLTKGYPYFLQEWGYQAWNHATETTITARVVEQVTPYVIERLDQNFFKVRFDRLTHGEKNFLRTIAELGPGSHRTGAIADLMQAKVTSLGPTRAQLIKKGMIYSPAHGEIAFTVPLFDDFMRRTIPHYSLTTIH